MATCSLAADLVPWVAVFLVAWSLYVAWPKALVTVTSPLTDKQYTVKNAPGYQAVADRLAFMELRIADFLAKAEAYAPGDPRLANIRRRWNGTLAEAPVDRDVAFSIGKGDISVCVRREDGSLEPENTTMFVLLHELAHVATDTYGHRPEFWANMQFLMELAEAVGSYTYEDFDARVSSYCGKPLTGSPLACVKNRRCDSELRRRDGAARPARPKNL
jgi:hypothetical protein